MPLHSQRRWLSLAILLVVIVAARFSRDRRQAESPIVPSEEAGARIEVPAPETAPDDATDAKPSAADPESAGSPDRAASRPPAPSASSPWVVPQVTVRDKSGRVVYRGPVDLGPTLERIDRGERLRQFQNDGTTFFNRERRLPKKPTDHYTEYVHPTPGLAGPGPQRVVTGKDGEAFYTFDHYLTFRKIR